MDNPNQEPQPGGDLPSQAQEPEGVQPLAGEEQKKSSLKMIVPIVVAIIVIAVIVWLAL